MELTLPTAPVALAPGVPSRVPVQVRNPYAQPVTLRLFVARGRAAGWATVDPPTLTLGPGETTEAAVVLCTPPEQPTSSSLVPFSVHVEDAGTGEPAGFASALLTVARPNPVAGSLTPRAERYGWDLRLANDTGISAPLQVTAVLDPPAGSATVQPDAVRLDPGNTAVIAVRARPRRPLIGAPRQFAVVVKVQDAFDAEREPYLTEVATGTRKPRVSSLLATIVAVVLALGATAGIYLLGDDLPLIGKNSKKTPAAAAPTPVTIVKPYAVIDVFSHRGAGGGRADAEAAQQKLATVNMPVRLVDSLSSDVLSDSDGGFWVLLQDGFPSIAAAQTYCDQWRAVAPKCRVTS
ncbi:MAG: hypothetical protein ABW046_16330 [Actinoplanes sp.]